MTGRWGTIVEERAQTATARLRQRLAQRTTQLLTVALCVVAAVRLLPFSAVYRGGDVVLSSNDPYFYRYLVEQTTAAAASPLDLGVLASLPSGASIGEPFLVATLWWFAEVAGGHVWTTGTILAWYPVVSAVVTGGLVYLIAVELSEDYRIGLAAVLFFAVVPGHAFRTGLGFADHHAFDYLWLTLTAFAFLRLAGDDRIQWPWSRRTVLGAALLGVGVAGQVLAWEAGPLLLVPLGLGLAVYAPFAVHRDRTSAFGAIVAGLAFGAALAGGAHVTFGWQVVAVAATPAVLWLVGAGLLVGVVIVDRLGLSSSALVVAELLAVAASIAIVWLAVPSLFVELDSGIAFLRSPATAGEMQSITATWGPVFGPLIMLGFTPFLAVPAMVWAGWDAVKRAAPGWLLLSLYAWTFLGLAIVQRRFTGELAPFISLFAGLGFVGLCSTLDLLESPDISRARQPSTDGGPSAATEGAGSAVAQQNDDSSGELELPGRRRAIILGSLGAVFTVFPALYSALIHPEVTIDPRKHDAARWMRQYAAERGWAYPENYVFSNWGRNRMYNYFVSGESRSYAFAQDNYQTFITSGSPVQWYEQLRSRTGFIVTTDSPSFGGMLSGRMWSRLHEGLGSRRGGSPGLDHYRIVYASSDGYLKVFTLVPGATIAGRGPANDDVPVRTDVSIPGGSFTYERMAATDEAGAFSVTVPQPGTYRVADAEVTVPESAVRDGDTVDVGRVE